ncbi:MAG TPA: Hpt domain-containing protein, partial [Polyangia bacterium]
MSGPAGFLEFFILEASDYVEQLDGLLLGGGSSGPDAEAVQRIARALRGTATMARMPSFAELASSMERVGRAIQQGTLQWEPGLSGVVVAAVDDLKALLHSARAWSPAQDQRANARAAELARYAPAQPSAAGAGPARGTPAPGVTGSPFLASETSNIAAGLELLTTRAGTAATA